MSISREEVLRVAALARLRFEGADEEAIADDMARIVDYVRRLEEVDTEGVEPLAHVLGLVNDPAEDAARPSMDRGTALKEAPGTAGPYFLFPRVIGDGGEAP